MTMKYEAVVFDLDDTLYAERDYVLSGFRAVGRWVESHLAVPSDAAFGELRDLFDAGSRHDAFDRWLETRGLAAEGRVAELLAVYRAHDPALVPFPEVPGLLSSLSGTYRLGLLSDGYLAVQRRKLRALGLANHFESIVFSDEWGRDAWKPSPRPFHVLLSRLGLSGPQAVYVADNPSKDFLGARRAGMSTVRFVWPQGMYAHLAPPSSAHAADCEIRDLNDLPAVLSGRSGGPAEVPCRREPQKV
jgi:putative hydrolase of the HAD superfamily